MSETRDKNMRSPHYGVPGFDPNASSGRMTQEERMREMESIKQSRQAVPEDETLREPSVVEYFRGRELPTDVWVVTGAAYYERFEDIPTKSRNKREIPPKIEKVEDQAAIARRVSPPLDGEPVDGSFRFAGEHGSQGLYVRVIRGETEERIGQTFRKKTILSWTPFNEEDIDPRDIRFV